MKKISVLIYCLFYAQAFAAAVDDTRQQEQIQRDIQQRIHEEMRQRELDYVQKRPVEIDVPQPVEAPDFIDDGGCVIVNSVEYIGNTVFSNKKIDKILLPYIGRCLSITEIDEMLQEFANLYIGAGYTTSRAYMQVPQEKIDEGVLELKIIEGMVAKVVLNDIKNSERFTAFPYMAGKALYLRDIEQGIDQMNRLASNDVTMNIVPTPDTLGYSDIVLENNKRDTTSISATIDNLGSKSTGEWRWGLRLSQDNLFNLNDQVNLGFNRAFNSNYSHSNSNSFTAGISVPFRYFTFNNYFSYSEYITSYILRQSGERFYSMGDSYNNTFSADYLYLRGRKYKLSVTAGYTYKRSENYMKVMDVKAKNEASSRSLSIAYIELPSTYYTPKGVLYIKPGYWQGIKLFGSLDDDDTPYSQKAQYSAWKLYSYYNHGFSKFNLMLTVDGQYSGDELYGSEGFSIGGEGSVRGFKEESTTGDKGVILKAEISANLGTLFKAGILNHYRISAFYDWGSVSSSSPYIESVKLAGAGASLSANYKYFTTSVTYAAALSKPDSFSENTSVYFRAGFNYSF